MRCLSTSLIAGCLGSVGAIGCTGDDGGSQTGTETDGTDGTAGDPTGGPEDTGDGTFDDTGDDDDDDTGEPGPPPPDDVVDEPEITECEDHPLAGPGDGTCDVEAGTGRAMLIRGAVMTPRGILRGGQVLVNEEGTLSCVDCDCTGHPDAADAAVLTCDQAVISPGLVNPHDHITFANNVPIGDGPDRYEHRHDWRTGAGGHVELDYDSGANQDVVRGSELRFLMSGVTTMASAGSAPGLVRNIDSNGALEGLLAQVANSDTFPLDDANGTTKLAGCDYGDNPTQGEFIDGLDSYLPHIAEGINTAAQNEFVCSVEELGLILPQTAVIHGVGMTPARIDQMREADSLLVWSPRSNVVLYGNTAPVTVYDHLSVPIALGTDWVPSGSINMFRELACADSLNRDYFDGHFTDFELWKMVTTHGAFAVGAEDGIGMLKPGYVADLAVFRTSDDKQDYRAIIEGTEADTILVVRGGDVLFGDDALVESLRPTCESLDVCGTAKRACVELDTGDTLAATRSALEEHYPLLFCGEPDDEPSCVPTRPDEYTGITDGDADGDGAPDEEDNCPNVFNPVRPIEGIQADSDDDGYGDVCDTCPLSADNDCTPYPVADIDDDGVPNGIDNCPDDANDDQADDDQDGHGDACDACPSANPGPAACISTIQAIRDPSHPEHPRVGAQVSFEDAVVTAIRDDNSGFYVQDPTGGDFSGLFVFTGSNADDVALGDVVRVSGIYEEFFDITEITSASFEITEAGGGLPLTPMVVDPADIADGGASAEPLESVLVRVENVSIAVMNPDGASDFDEFEIDDGLRIDDLVFDALDNTCAVGTTFDAIVGVAGFSFDHFKLYPRFSADLENPSCDPF